MNEKVVVRSDSHREAVDAICGSRKGKQTYFASPRGQRMWALLGTPPDGAHLETTAIAHIAPWLGRWHVGCPYRAFEHFIGRRFPYLESLPCATRSRSTTAFAACLFTAFARLIVLSWRSRSFLHLPRAATTDAPHIPTAAPSMRAPTGVKQVRRS